MDGCQLPREFQLFQVFSETLPDFAGNLVGVRDDFVESSIFVQPHCRSLRANLRHARYVVRGVTDESQVINNLFGGNVELLLDTIAIHDPVGHCIDQRDIILDKLCHILVAGGDQARHVVSLCLLNEGTDNVICLDTLDTQQGQAKCRNNVE